MKSMLNKAIEIAAKAHSGQVDKGGNPYILHPLRVMMNFCDACWHCAVPEREKGLRELPIQSGFNVLDDNI